MHQEQHDIVEITIKDIIGFFQKYFLLLTISLIGGAVLGILFSFTISKTFKAQTILLPEYKIGGGNSFFSMVGSGNSGEGAEKLIPNLYPNILSSSPFAIFLLKQPVTDQNNRVYKSFEQYLKRDSASVSFISNFFTTNTNEKKQPVKARILLPDKDILSLDVTIQQMITSVSTLVKTDVDIKNSIITISCEMTDPVVAAILVEAGKKYLVQYVEEYRTYKSNIQVTFLEQRVWEAKKRLQGSEYSLQNYRDQNRNTFLNTARIQEQRLQADFMLSQSIYNDLVIKLEQARIKVKEERPVFKVLEPSKIPLTKSGPNRFLIGTLVGFLASFATLLYIIFFKERFF